MNLVKIFFNKNKLSKNIFSRYYSLVSNTQRSLGNDTNTQISLIACTDNKYGISKDGEIPWSIKEDMHFFQDITTKNNISCKKNALIMGKQTWLSLPDKSRGFKNRINIVLSSSLSQFDLDQTNVTASQTWLANSMYSATTLINRMNINNIFICGGADVYRKILRDYKINNIYLTYIDSDFRCNKFFPMDELIHWRDTQIIPDPIIKRFIVADNKNNQTYPLFIKKYYDRYIKVTEETKYLDLMERIINEGHRRDTRNGVTMSIFGDKLEFDLSKGFPLLTTKKISLYNIFHELMFFIKGSTNTNILKDLKVNIWNNNTSRDFLDSNGLKHYIEGDMGPMYGFQWRFNNAIYEGCHANYDGKGFDQLKYCIELIKSDPHSRRIIMTTYNPSQSKEGCLFPCHGVFIQFYLENNQLSCMMIQRSADIFLGLPYNIASYALLTHMICEVVNNDKSYKGPQISPGRLIISIGDAHLYQSHYSQAVRQILREPMDFPKLKFNRSVSKIENFVFDDLNLIEYDPYPNITAKMVA